MWQNQAMLVQTLQPLAPKVKPVELDKFWYKLSRGEICVANFIPPTNGASQGSYLVKKNC